MLKYALTIRETIAGIWGKFGTFIFCAYITHKILV